MEKIGQRKKRTAKWKTMQKTNVVPNCASSSPLPCPSISDAFECGSKPPWHRRVHMLYVGPGKSHVPLSPVRFDDRSTIQTEEQSLTSSSKAAVQIVSPRVRFVKFSQLREKFATSESDITGRTGDSSIEVPEDAESSSSDVLHIVVPVD